MSRPSCHVRCEISLLGRRPGFWWSGTLNCMMRSCSVQMFEMLSVCIVYCTKCFWDRHLVVLDCSVKQTRRLVSWYCPCKFVELIMLLVARWASASSPTTGDELTLTSLLPTASGKYLTLKYKYKYSGHKYEYEYKYFETVLEYYSSTSTRVLLEYKYKYQVPHLCLPWQYRWTFYYFNWLFC